MAPIPQRLTITHRAWALARPMATARGIRTSTDVILAELYDGSARGRGEAVPIERFGESAESVIAALEAMKPAIYTGLRRETLQDAMPPGAARNALDCAFWDIDAKRVYQNVIELGGFGPTRPVTTAYTLGFDTAVAMAVQAAAQRTRQILRLELGDEGDLERVRAVRQAAPVSRLIIDANEGWTADQLAAFMPELAELRVELVEQPLPADADSALNGVAHPVALCADESCRSLGDLDGLTGTYSAVNIRLDKLGGLTAAMALAAEAKRRGLRVVLGGSLGTSLGIAPALFIADQADIVALDGPLHLAIDRGSALRYDGSTVHPPNVNLWGGPG